MIVIESPRRLVTGFGDILKGCPAYVDIEVANALKVCGYRSGYQTIGNDSCVVYTIYTTFENMLPTGIDGGGYGFLTFHTFYKGTLESSESWHSDTSRLTTENGNAGSGSDIIRNVSVNRFELITNDDGTLADPPLLCLQFNTESECIAYLQGQLSPKDATNYSQCDWTVYVSGESPYQTVKLLWNATYLESDDSINLDDVKIQLGVYAMLEGGNDSHYIDLGEYSYTEGFLYFPQSLYKGSYIFLSFLLKIPQEDGTYIYSSECVITFNPSSGLYTDKYYGYAINNELLGTLFPTEPFEPISGSKLDGSRVIINSGDGSEDNGYLDRADELQEVDLDTYYDGVNLLTNTYSMNIANMQNVAQELWNGTFADNIQLLNNSPIENIVSANVFPFNTNNGTTKEVYIGNVDMLVSGQGVNNGIFDIGTFVIKPYYNSYADYQPYTRVYLYLPFLGFVELSIDDTINRTVTIRYVVDYATGDTNILLICGGVPIQKYRCNTSISLRLSSSGLNQQMLGNLLSGIGLVGDVASENLMGAIGDIASIITNTPHATQATSNSSSTDCKSGLYAFLLYVRPQWYLPSGFAHTFGRPCMLTKTISNLTGFTKLAQGVDLSGISCTKSEREEIESILTSGFYV